MKCIRKVLNVSIIVSNVHEIIVQSKKSVELEWVILRMLITLREKTMLIVDTKFCDRALKSLGPIWYQIFFLGSNHIPLVSQEHKQIFKIVAYARVQAIGRK